MNYIVVIPARMASSRFPGKPLADILGKSMIQRTYEQVLKVVPADKIIVATDSILIKEHMEQLGYNACMTSSECLTGTDRVAEVAALFDFDCYINVQGDEPVINPEDIKAIIALASQNPQSIINGYTKITNPNDFLNRSVPKVVLRNDERLLYMSRAPIPGNKTNTFQYGWRQVCVYAFPQNALVSFANQKSKSVLEEVEDIEILRFLELGYEVQMLEMSDDSIAVDHVEDVEKVIKRLHEA